MSNSPENHELSKILSELETKIPKPSSRGEKPKNPPFPERPPRRKERFEVNIDKRDFLRVDSPPPEKHPKQKKKKSKLGLLIWILSIVAVSAALAITLMLFISDFYAIGSPSKAVEIDIPRASSTAQIAGILKDAGVIKHPLFFRVASKLMKADGTFNYGGYTVDTADSYGDIVEKLQQISNKRKDVVTITFKEGQTIEQFAKTAAESGICTEEEFLEAASAEYNMPFEKWMQPNSLKFHKYEGCLAPDTYEFFKDSKAKDIVKKMLEEFGKIADEKLYSKMVERGMTFDQTIALASIIEKEAGFSKDMTMISSVFHNRLKNPNKFPKLESDVTYKYAHDVVLAAIKNDSEIKNKDERVNAYDTYKCVGLPAGAICNPSYDAISAALNPEASDYFYFLANIETKETFYAKTMEEHVANYAKAGIKK